MYKDFNMSQLKRDKMIKKQFLKIQKKEKGNHEIVNKQMHYVMNQHRFKKMHQKQKPLKNFQFVQRTILSKTKRMIKQE